MSDQNIMRALKDEQYRMSLTEEERQQLPENPAGVFELREEDLSSIAGGRMLETYATGACSDGCTGRLGCTA